MQQLSLLFLSDIFVQTEILPIKLMDFSRIQVGRGIGGIKRNFKFY